MIKICVICGNEFNALYSAKTCSDKCSKKLKHKTRIIHNNNQTSEQKIIRRSQTKFKHLNSITIEHTQIITRCVYIVNTDKIIISNCFVASSGYTGAGKTNKNSSVWLGDKAEIILMNMFDRVEKMPNGNPGYDFICGKGYKIDAKSACLRKCNLGTWRFGIKRNKIADYFLCLALDNRQDLNPLHVWLIPGEDINHLSGATISKSTLDKWSQYEQPLDKVLSCCNNLRNK